MYALVKIHRPNKTALAQYIHGVSDLDIIQAVIDEIRADISRAETMKLLNGKTKGEL